MAAYYHPTTHADTGLYGSQTPNDVGGGEGAGRAGGGDSSMDKYDENLGRQTGEQFQITYDSVLLYDDWFPRTLGKTG